VGGKKGIESTINLSFHFFSGSWPHLPPLPPPPPALPQHPVTLPLLPHLPQSFGPSALGPSTAAAAAASYDLNKISARTNANEFKRFW
jgi:hypothetical protein